MCFSPFKILRKLVDFSKIGVFLAYLVEVLNLRFMKSLSESIFKNFVIFNDLDENGK